MTRRRRAACAVLIAAAVFAAPAISSEPTEAAWVDAEHATSGLAAGTVPPPVGLSCTAGLLQPVVFRWTPATGGLPVSGYEWRLSPATTATPATPPTSGNTWSVTISSALIGIGSTRTFSVASVGPGGWRSVAVTGTASATTVIVDVVTSCSVP